MIFQFSTKSFYIILYFKTNTFRILIDIKKFIFRKAYMLEKKYRKIVSVENSRI